ncbi:MAG: glycosyltransferase family 4 protein [Actinomycetes bacterium]
MSLQKVLFVHGGLPHQMSSFVAQDFALLSEFCQVEELGLAAISLRFRHLLCNPAVWRAVLRNDLVFGWFAVCTPVVTIARITGRPSLLVGGGADVVQMPEIGYGLSQMRDWQRRLTTMGFRLASKVLLFSESSRRSLLEMPYMRPRNLETLYLGVDVDHFKPGTAKMPQALTVGYVTSNNLRRKGLRTFVEAAQKTPEIDYHLAGKTLDQSAFEELQSIAPPNLSFRGYLTESQLLAEYQHARVYAQLSMHEGFGLALAEAMACACVPVTTSQGSIPELVGDTGLFVPVEDPQAAGNAVRQIMHDPLGDRLGQLARQRVADLFPLSRRRQGLRQAIENATTGVHA